MYRLFPTLVLFIMSIHSVSAESLKEIYDLAIDNDSEYLAAIAGYEAVKEETAIASSNFRPSVDIGATRTHRHTDSYTAKTIIPPATTLLQPSTSTYSNSLSATVSMPLYNYANIVANNRAKTVVSQAEITFANAKQDLIIKVAKRYFNVLAAQDNVKFSTAEKHAISRQLDQTKQRFDVGLVAITDVHEAQARYDLSVARGIASENDLQNKLEVLREVTGQYHENLFSLTDKTRLIRPDPEDIEAWTKMALKQNLDIQSSEFNVAIAYDFIRSSRAGYHPNINLGLTYSPKDSFSSNTTTVSDTISSSISLSYNFYNGGGTSSAVRQAKLYHTQAKEFLEQIKRATIRRTRNAYLNVTAGISRVKALRQAVVSRQSAQRASEAGFEVGTKTTVDVLDSRRELFSAQNEYSQSRYDYILNTLELKKEAGKLAVSDIELVSNWSN